MSRISPPEIWTAEKIIELINEGNLPPWSKSWSWTAEHAPHNLMNPKIPYKSLNYMLLSMVSEILGSPFFITPKQLFAIKGAKIKEGENKRTWPVFFFGTTLKKDDDGKDKKIWFCKGYRVFNINQTEGIPEDRIPVLPKPETFEHTPIEECEKIIGKYIRGCNNGPDINHHGQVACYSNSDDRIYMPHRDMFRTPEEYYSTRFHEMVHSTGHKDRLDRAAVQHVKFASHAYSQEELVAEFGAAMLCGKAGIANKTIENSASYIKSWASKLNPEMLILGSREARKAFEYIVGESEEGE